MTRRDVDVGGTGNACGWFACVRMMVACSPSVCLSASASASVSLSLYLSISLSLYLSISLSLYLSFSLVPLEMSRSRAGRPDQAKHSGNHAVHTATVWERRDKQSRRLATGESSRTWYCFTAAPSVEGLLRYNTRIR